MKACRLVDLDFGRAQTDSSRLEIKGNDCFRFQSVSQAFCDFWSVMIFAPTHHFCQDLAGGTIMGFWPIDNGIAFPGKFVWYIRWNDFDLNFCQVCRFIWIVYLHELVFTAHGSTIQIYYTLSHHQLMTDSIWSWTSRSVWTWSWSFVP